MTVMEFILRMRDEASAKMQQVRATLRGTAEQADKTNPALGRTGTEITNMAGAFAKARESMMKVVGVGGMLVGTFTASYQAAKPLGEYIRRMWDPVAKAAHDWEKLEKKIRQVDEWVKRQGDDEKARLEKVSKGYDEQADAIAKAEEARRALDAAAKSGLTGKQAQAELDAARARASVRSSAVTQLQDEIETERANRDSLATGTSRDEKYRGQFLASEAKIERMQAALREAQASYEEAETQVATAIATLDQARKNDINERMEKLKEHYRKDLDLRLENVRKEADALGEAKSKAEDRLSRAKDASQAAWGWYRDPAAFRRQLDEEKAQKSAEEQFARDAAALEERRQRSSAGVFGDRALNLSEREQAVERVLKAREEEAAAKKDLAKIEENTRGLKDTMEKLMALKG